MKQILQNPRTGTLELAEVPAPGVARGQVLVRNAFSVVSPGTEKLAMDFARKSLLAKARSRPDLVRQVTRKLRQEGALSTYRAVTSRLEMPQPLGYSSAGVVEAVGEAVDAYRPGDRVACAGAGYACHAEIIVVPENLAAPVPHPLSLDRAAFGTLGAIALQGLRVANPTLGEVGAVIGLGPIGQLAVQLLRANGCRVLAIDLAADRVKQALDQGADWGAAPGDHLEPWKAAATSGYGADFAIVTASSDSASPLHLAAQLCRLKGRIALVGALPIDVDRRLLYEKELELRMSTSYGPGRYDRVYEEDGFDYPLPWVRWTERRNIEAFLTLAARGDIDPRRLDVELVDFREAVHIYTQLASGKRRALAALFRYPDVARDGRTLRLDDKRLPLRHRRSSRGHVGIAFLGAGTYARSALLPLLARRKHARLIALVTATGASARSTGQRFRFERCGTDPESAFSDPDIDLVFITTRHDTHADLAIRSLQAGKAVWLEKPIGLSMDEVYRVLEAARSTNGFLMVGYNRRFSRHIEAIRQAIAKRSGPLALHYLVAAGPPPRNSWLMDPEIGGGRIIGEVCHFVDLCTYLTGLLPSDVVSRPLTSSTRTDDSLMALLAFPDGSTASIAYLAQAAGSIPKERLEISWDGRTARCENFRSTAILDRGVSIRTYTQDKGQANAIALAIKAVREASPSPFSLRELAAVSAATFQLHSTPPSQEPGPESRT